MMVLILNSLYFGCCIPEDLLSLKSGNGALKVLTLGQSYFSTLSIVCHTRGYFDLLYRIWISLSECCYSESGFLKEGNLVL